MVTSERTATLRGVLLSALGIPAAACIVIASIFIVLMPAFAGYPITGDELQGPALFGGFSLVLLAIAWRAYRRTKRTKDAASVSHLLTRAVPWLTIAGVVLGIVIGRALGMGAVEAMQSRVDNICQIAIGTHDDLLPTCRDQGPRCLHEAKKLDAEHANEGFSYDTASPIHSRKDKYGVECLRAALKL